MRFGEPSEFAVEAYHEPSGVEWLGFGRMCLYVEGTALGNLLDEHCSLFHAVDRFREVSSCAGELWDISFAGLSHAQMFALLDDALYTGTESRCERYGRFDFLTNTGEQFDGSKTFIVCSPDRQVHILWRSPDDRFGASTVGIGYFRAVAEAFVSWFDEQVHITRPTAEPGDAADREQGCRLRCSCLPSCVYAAIDAQRARRS
jgi:hypothetical protein